MADLIDAIRPGDRVTIVNRFGQQKSGKAVIYNAQYRSWTLNMGGTHGTPGIATNENIVKVSPSKKRASAGALLLAYGPLRDPRMRKENPVTMIDFAELKARFPKGSRVQLHPATDDWMRGDRYGEVVGYGKAREYVGPSNTRYKIRPVLVKLDKSGRTKRHSPHNLFSVDAGEDDKAPRQRNPVKNRTHSVQAISVKRLPATNTKGARYKATTASGISITLNEDFELDAYPNAVKAAEALQEKLKWRGTLVGGSSADGWVFTFDSHAHGDGEFRNMNPINPASTYEIAGAKAGLAARRGDQATVNHWREWKRNALPYERESDRPALEKAFADAYKANATPRGPKSNPHKMSAQKHTFIGFNKVTRRPQLLNSMTHSDGVPTGFADRYEGFWGPFTLKEARRELKKIHAGLRATKAKLKKNPGAWVIAAYLPGAGGGAKAKRLTYDANRNRFSDNSKPALYRTKIAAEEKARTLVDRYPLMLSKYQVVAEPAQGDEAGAVFGARPRQRNPKGRYAGDRRKVKVYSIEFRSPKGATLFGADETARVSVRGADTASEAESMARKSLADQFGIAAAEQAISNGVFLIPADDIGKHGNYARPKT